MVRGDESFADDGKGGAAVEVNHQASLVRLSELQQLCPSIGAMLQVFKFVMFRDRIEIGRFPPELLALAFSNITDTTLKAWSEAQGPFVPMFRECIRAVIAILRPEFKPVLASCAPSLLHQYQVAPTNIKLLLSRPKLCLGLTNDWNVQQRNCWLGS